MSRFDAALFDLDGTVYHAGRVLDGAPELFTRLREEEIPYLFVTNRANLTPRFIADKLRSQGIACEDDDVLTAATATARCLADEKDGDGGEFAGNAFVVGESALFAALAERGIRTLDLEDEGPVPDWVIVGIDLNITYDKISRAAYWILEGASFVGTNPDRLTTGPGGIKKAGAGAIVGAIEAAVEIEPRIIGKPRRALFDIALRRLADLGHTVSSDRVLMVGDNLATDIAGGNAAGLPTAFLLTGVSSVSDIERLGVEPTYTTADYSELGRILHG